MSNNVIIFGPTGNIASVAALSAQEKGAKVFLAMRDPRKRIPGLNAELEAAGGFERIAADMTHPETVRAAVQQSAAKRAFIYVAHQSKDHMRATLEAMKAAGIEFVVFLSSFTVTEPLEAIQSSDPIPYSHAQVEINLEQVFGSGNFVAIRPGGFATDMLRWKDAIRSGHLSLYGLKFKMDCITPEDMGHVSGTILANGTDERAVYLYGPQLATQEEMVATIAKALGKELKLTGQTPEEATEKMKAAGVPPSIAEWTVARRNDNNPEEVFRPQYDQGVYNVQKYTGRPATTLEDWVTGNTALFV